MTSTLLLVLIILIIASSTFTLGWYLREIRIAIKDLQAKSKQQEPPIGATFGAYAPVNEFKRTNQPGEVGLVEAKTPQRVEFDAQEALRREARGE